MDASGNFAQSVAQFSSQQSYFDSNKPFDDLNSTVKKHPHAREIYLFATTSPTPSASSDFDNRITEWKTAHPGVKVSISSGKDIADFIFNNLHSDELVSALKHELPSLVRFAEQNALSHSIPTQLNYTVRPRLEEQITEKLRNDHYVVLSGISGIGKSELAIRVAKAFSVGTRVWLDGADVPGPDSLQSLCVQRRGFPHNIATMLRTSSCLAIVDNVAVPWRMEAIESLLGEHGYVILTSQVSGPHSRTIQISHPNKDEAWSILNAASSHSCPADEFDEIYRLTNGHPLLLRVLGSLLHDGIDWHSLSKLCLELVAHGEDDANQRICRRVLRQHRDSVREELLIFLWVQCATVDVELLDACVSKLSFRKLDSRCLLAPSSRDTVRIHDIIFRSAAVELGEGSNLFASFRRKLKETIGGYAKANKAVLERIVRRHCDLFSRECKEDVCWEFLYAMAIQRRDDQPIELFESSLSAVLEQRTAIKSPIEIWAMIECLEAIYSGVNKRSGKKSAAARIERFMAVFEILAAEAPRLGLEYDVSHHQAKMLIKTDRFEQGEAIMRRLLDSPEANDATRLQLVRCIMGRQRKEVCADGQLVAPREEARQITIALCESEGDEGDEMLRLAAWDELSRFWPEELVQRVKGLRALLERVSGDDVTRAYSTVAAIGARVGYMEPRIALELYRLLNDEEVSFSSTEDRLAWARLQCVAGKALAEQGNTSEAETFWRQARSAFSECSLESLNQYQRQHYAEICILLKDFRHAKYVLESAKDKERSSDFWPYWLAKAELGLNQPESALRAIDGGLAALRDPKYRATFLEVRYRARAATGQQDAVSDLEAAYAAADNPKFKQELQERLQLVKSSAA